MTKPENLKIVINKVFNKCFYNVTNFELEPEGKEYDACQFELDSKKVICRSSKITPKKVGQFVTFWRRNKQGVTEPYTELDDLDFYVINVKRETRFGQFVFPKSILIKKGILSTSKKDGKRGFRVYPSWVEAQNKQAKQTQKWQLNYFYEINDSIDFDKVKELYLYS